jgi:DNA-binding IscR family transcriptional regulator
LQLSWTIVLLGALFTYAHQHHGKGLMGEKIHTASDLARKVVALTILKHIITCFENGDPPPTLKQIVDSFHLPYILANQSLQTLKASSLVSEVVGSQSGGPAYQPARDIQTLTLSIFMSAWDHQGDDLPPAGRDSDVARIEAVMEQLGTEIENSAANQLVKDL